MAAPHGFSWVERPRLAALAQPSERDDFVWLRAKGIQVLLALSEETPHRDWINDAGLMVFHEPIEDFAAPSQEQLDRCVSVIDRAHGQDMGVAVHCTAGRGRTGTVLAAWLVSRGKDAQQAIDHIRRLRPGSIETEDQQEAIQEFARRRRQDQ